MPRDREETLELLADFLDGIARAVVQGVRDSYDYDAPRMHKLRKVTRRNNTRDEIVDRLRAEFHGVSGVRIVDHDQTTHFHFRDAYVCRVKKADECGDVELAKTQTAFDFQCNTAMSSAMGLEEIENLYIGYIDTADPRNPTAALISPSSLGINWMEELPPPSLTDVVEITPAAPSPDDQDDLVRPLVQPSIRAANDEDTE